MSHDSERVAFSGRHCQIHITADNLQYHFYLVNTATGAETKLGVAETRYLFSEVAGGFTGVVMGLFAVDKKEQNTWTEFTSLKVIHE